MAFLDRYTFEQTLAERGAVTTRLMRRDDGTRVVVKSLSLRRSQDPRDVELFERETGVLKHLDHKAIPRLLDSGVDDAGDGDVVFHLVQSHVQGQTLEGWVNDGRSFTEAEVTAIALDLADVLATLHGTSPPLVHRDIKPSNVVRNDAGAVFLIDFGAAKRAARDGTAIGTWGYMAPEQMEGRASPASDVFGLGMTLVFLLTHKHPDAFADHGGVRAAWRAQANVSAAFADLVNACIALDETARPRDGAALRERLLHLHDRPTPTPTPTTTTPRRSPAVAAVAGSALIVLMGLGTWLMVARDPLPPPTTTTTTTPTTATPKQPTTLEPTTSPVLPQKIPASVRLGAPGLIELLECAGRARRAVQSEERYLSWLVEKDGKKLAPTCTEKNIYGLYALYDDAPDRCRAAAVAAGDDAGRAAAALADSLTTLTPLVAAAARYYEAEDHKDDDCGEGRAMHAPLVAAFAATRAAYADVLRAKHTLAKSPAPDDVDMAAYRRALDAAIALGDPALPFDKRRAAVDAYDEALKACPKPLIAIGVNVEALRKWARGSNDIVGQMSISGVDTSTANAITMRMIFD